MDSFIKEIECNSYQDFLNKIKCLRNGGVNIFRGQMDSAWKLTPSLIRSKKDIFDISHNLDFGFSGYENILRYELFLLTGFIHSCDRQGLSIPGDCSSLRKKIGILKDREAFFEMVPYDPFSVNPYLGLGRMINEKISQEDYPLIAMAQHHGIPTRLLDWTKNPMVAAYFAVCDLPNYYRAGSTRYAGKVAVWVLDFEKINNEKDFPFKAVSFPMSISKNLRVQEGCFTVFSGKGNEARDFELDAFIEACEGEYEDFLVKYTLPVSEAFDLFCELYKEGVSCSSIYPGASGAATEVLEIANFREWQGEGVVGYDD